MEPLLMRNLADLDDSSAEQATQVFVDGFYQHLKMFSDNKTVLVKALQHSLVREQFFVALHNKQVVSITAYSTNRKRSIAFDKTVLQREFGKLKGWLCYTFLSKELQKPLRIANHQCYIESVATAPEARGKGAAFALQNYIFEQLKYEEFILEVVDTNPAAIKLYERLGYVVFDKRKQKLFRKQAGFNERFYMKKRIRTD